MSDFKTADGTPVIGIAGWKNSGKTMLAVRLIAEFSARGLRVASVKHAHHNFQIDDADTDSARHRRAGSAQVAIVSAKRWALVTELGDAAEPEFADVIAMLAPCDLIIVEGYKTAAIPKIEARRGTSNSDKPLAPTDPNIFAIAAETPEALQDRLPIFHLDDIAPLADFLATRFSLKAGRRHPQ